MVTAITNGIEVSVEVTYQAEFSSPLQHHYVFTYKVTIQNKSTHTVQLLRRKWVISDAAETTKIVEGDGVVGQQPILEPGQTHSYVSGCNLKSGMGKMRGSYTMQKLFDGKTLEVTVPEFQMIANIFHN
ncbi:Co2+/Mg2+ efflux protein ApaG [Algoriphagus zhangzhouensis]|uniref:ApaG protein n=1 Tax=Algoriphagus zhangzhouensis TaxID=1073327 RepID=A0A1M7ZJL7_9BACT|nr:Co2+/Mg2+ efflux protein ApaG [Algoriphagus zhangzhouensis]TDY43504.1 ApaG protein [Algoriphagus zhangzhouensis]SHO65094.1 ApaG protein [Algoriphagus zhangzhouensis]